MFLAFFFTGSTPEVVGLAGAAATLLGVWLNWRRQEHIEEIEEHVKNGKLTTEQAWRRMRLVNWRAQAVVFAGTGLLAFAVYRAMG
jgi:hypothetical protein